MDSGRPFRIARPEKPRSGPVKPALSRQSAVTPSPAPAPEKPIKPQTPVTPERKVEPKTATPVAPKKPRRTWAFVAVILVLAGFAVIGWLLLKPSELTIDTTRSQAVTTVDGQVFFGKVSPAGDEAIEIKNAYSLTEATDASDKSQDASKLLRLSNRVYSPSGDIILPKQQILSYEELDPDGQIANLLDESNN